MALPGLFDHPLTALALRVVAAALSFGVAVALARILGVQEFGSYGVVLAAVNIGATLALLGHEALANRIVATVADPHPYLRQAATQVWSMGAAMLLVMLLLLQLPAFGRHGQSAFLALLPWLPLLARTRLAEGAIRGAHRAGHAMLADGIVRPCLVLAGLGMLIALQQRGTGVVIAALLVSAVIAVMLALRWERRFVTADVQRSGPHSNDTRLSLGLYLSSLLSIATNQLPLLIAGASSDPSAAGLYAAAERLAFAAGLVSNSVYQAIASRLAAAYAGGDLAALRQLAIRQTRVVSAITFALCVLAFPLAPWLMGAYGTEFASAATAMRWLLTVPMLTALAGPVTQILFMSGHEKDHVSTMIVTLAVQLCAYALLVPRFGLDGVVWSVVLGAALWNGLLVERVRRRLGIDAWFLLGRPARAAQP